MLRLVVGACRRAYTCSCLPTTAISGRSPSALLALHGSNIPVAHFHSVPTLCVLDKELRGKKKIMKLSDMMKQEPLDTTEEDNVEGDLTGLTEAGVTIPTLETHSMLVDGVPYSELPIVHIKSSMNNTIMSITDHTGVKHILINSCGREGFKHVKKSTNVAAQATGLSLGLKARKKGVTTVRVAVKGIGAGRLASIKGLQMAGMKIASITDTTPLPHNGVRARKPKRR